MNERTIMGSRASGQLAALFIGAWLSACGSATTDVDTVTPTLVQAVCEQPADAWTPSTAGSIRFIDRDTGLEVAPPVHGSLLPDGKVLLFGWSQSYVLNPTELPTGPGTVPVDMKVTPLRNEQDFIGCGGQAQLKDGRVLVAGGVWAECSALEVPHPQCLRPSCVNPLVDCTPAAGKVWTCTDNGGPSLVCQLERGLETASIYDATVMPNTFTRIAQSMSGLLTRYYPKRSRRCRAARRWSWGATISASSQSRL